MNDMLEGKQLLSQHSAIYNGIIKALAEPYQVIDTERGLRVIDLIADFAWRIHPGLFADVRLDNWALAIGKAIWAKHRLSSLAPLPPSEKQGKRVLHVVTHTYNVGGHTRLLWNIIRNDVHSIHDVAVVQQTADELPNWLQQAVSDSDGSIISLANHSLTQQVALLQQLLTASYDYIFYHIHPNDSISVAALAAFPRPPILAINHSDHTFWLGATIAEVVVAFRTWSLDFSLLNRNAQQVALLPTPVNFLAFEMAEKLDARRELNILDGQVLLLSVASAFKFRPSAKYNYFRLVKRVLEANPHVIAKVVGVSREEAADVGFEPHERLELLGKVENPGVYYKAADIYIDSIPLSSITSLFEAMYFGCYPVLQFNPMSILILDKEVVMDGLVQHTRNEDEEVACIQRAVNEPVFRKEKAREGSERIKNNFMGANWEAYLSDLYAMAAQRVEQAPQVRLVENAGLTITDQESAELSYTFFGAAPNFLLYSLINRKDHFSVSDLVKIYRTLLRSGLPADQRLTIRQVLYFVKQKIKRKSASGVA